MNALWFFIKKLAAYRWQLLLGLLLSVILATASIALLSLSGWFISAAAFAGLSVATATFFNYFIPAGTIRFLALIRIASRYAERVVNHDFTFKILTELRVWFYRILLPLAPAHLMSRRSGELLNSLTHDIDTLDHLYLRILTPICIALLTTVGVYLFITLYSHHIAIVTLMMFLLALIMIPFITLIAGKRIGIALATSIADLRTQLIDMIQGMTAILFYVNKENRLDKIKQEQDKLSQAQKKLAFLKGFTVSTISLLSGLSVILALYIGIPLVHQSHINGAQLAMIVLCIIVAFEQLLPLPLAFLSIGKTQTAAKRIYSIASSTPTVTFPDNTKTISDLAHPVITLQDVTFQYPTRTTPSLSHINLTIPYGTKLSVTGASGTGKTTLMHLLTRIWDPNTGTITINDLPLQNYSEADLRQTIATVPQQVHIFNTSVRDNLTLMQPSISDDQLYDILAVVDLADTIKSLPNGLNTQMGDFGRQFSGGQIRRIGIARALLTNAPIQIWDEPSTGLNQTLLEMIWQRCQPIIKDKTVIIITHDKHILSKMSESILIQNGKCEIQ